MLLNGSLRAKDAFHTGVLASQAVSGISLRTVVLRKVLPEEKKIFCHTDLRSPKVAELMAHPQVSWLFYDAVRRLQFRLSGTASLHYNDELADLHWKNTSLSSRKCYLASDAPGKIQTHPTDTLPAHLQDRALPEIAESEAGKANFVVIQTQVQTLDWLFLNSHGHRRCQFQYQHGNLSLMHWVAP